MYRFIHIDEDGIDIEYTIDKWDITWVDLVDHFQDFLSGCGYIFDKTEFEMSNILNEFHENLLKDKYQWPKQMKSREND